MSWKHGEETLAKTNRMQLRERGFPDSDECPMPVEHTPSDTLWVVWKDERTEFMASETEWISAKDTWEVLP